MTQMEKVCQCIYSGGLPVDLYGRCSSGQISRRCAWQYVPKPKTVVIDIDRCASGSEWEADRRAASRFICEVKKKSSHIISFKSKRQTCAVIFFWME